ncbi:hypothetical protein LWI29_028577 [Acer saccharum]|uniref:Uncharacterized protein n=1 Tax=Acer saccharum TaxID=4024 RepID=A0AA39VRM3_ACESA|nr:hypothetical protein LWI29_028577 [Acer saccharum]
MRERKKEENKTRREVREEVEEKRKSSLFFDEIRPPATWVFPFTVRSCTAALPSRFSWLVLKLSHESFLCTILENFSFDSFAACLNPDAMVNKALKGPYLLADQGEITQSDIEDHRGIQVRYSPENPSFVDCENNAVDEKCLREYMTFFRIPYSVRRCFSLA